MAWEVDSMENLKQKFILLHQTGKHTMVELCRDFGISRPTGYAILKRYEDEGWDALEERSRRHQGHPRQTSSEVGTPDGERGSCWSCSRGRCLGLNCPASRL
jgi:transposase